MPASMLQLFCYAKKYNFVFFKKVPHYPGTNPAPNPHQPCASLAHLDYLPNVVRFLSIFGRVLPVLPQTKSVLARAVCVP